MSIRFIIACVLAALLALFCHKFMAVGEQQRPAGKRPTTNDERTARPANASPPGDESATPAEKGTGSKPTGKTAPQLAAGGRQWRLEFADPSLPDEIRQRIAYDLTLVFGHLPETIIDPLPFPIEIDGRQFDRRIRFAGGTNRRPEILFNSGFECLEKGADESKLYVPKGVVDAYRKAIGLADMNRAAYQQLDGFLRRMTELREHPIEDVPGLFVVADDFKSAEADLEAVPTSGFAEAWGGKLYREASVLDVTSTIGTPFGKYGSLVAKTYALSPTGLDDLPPLVFGNGRWRFLLLRPPT